jgi:glycosyltransferase involved in cell wall biosynthesis
MNTCISIIIPFYNRADTIGATLDSLQRQSDRDWMCIVVDDGSTDIGVSVVEQYAFADPRIQLVRRPDVFLKGPNSCRNYGFSLSKGAFVYWMDSDDVLLPGALTRYRAAFQPETDVVIAPLEKVDVFSGKVLERNCILSDNLIEDYFTGVISFYVCGPMWRRSFLERQSELFDETIRNLDDFDFNLRMWYALPKAVFLDEPSVIYLQHDDSLKKELKKGNPAEIDSAFRARFKHLDLLSAQDPANKIKYERHIAFFYKKTLRNSLILKQPWWEYYSALFRLLWKTRDFFGLLKLNFGVLGYIVFNKGYRFFE